MDGAERIAAVIVTYNPDVANVLALVATLVASDVHCVIVDNTAADTPFAAEGRCKVVRTGENLGVAAAQNLGIRASRAAGCRRIVFFDQDSIVDAAFIAGLAATFADPAVRVAAPVFYDRQKGFGYPLVHVTRHGLRRKIRPESLTGPIDVSTAISSGTMVDAVVFDYVGLMDEALFIDYVDTEWCLRCAAHGILVRINPAVRMSHSIGEGSLSLAGFRIPVHGPQRRYYRIRNAFLLWRRPWVPRLMLIREIAYALIHQCILALHFGRDRGAYVRYYLKAVADGVRGISGR